MDVDVMHVPQRETGMTPYEIMLSESQERMLMVVHKGREREVESIFEKWDLHAVQVGVVTAGDRLRIYERGALVADVPNRALTDEAPVYRRPMQQPAWQADLQRLDPSALGPAPSPQEAFDALVAAPTIASKRWAYRQYDHTVGTNTVAQPGATAAVVRVKGTTVALAISVDGNGRFAYLDPYAGGMLAVAEAARNVACAGGEPIGATNNLNFGNPERPEIMWQFAEAVRGIGDACRSLEVPITGGNVSLYNETEGRAIFPTPILGVVGLIGDVTRTCTRTFKQRGAAVLALGDNRGELGGSEYLSLMHGVVAGVPPVLDLVRERALQRLIVQLIGTGLVQSAHDCAEGGVAVALAECTFDSGGIGVQADLAAAGPAGDYQAAATLFGESASRILVSVAQEHVEAVLSACRTTGVPVASIGLTGGERITVSVDGVARVETPVASAESAWLTAIERRMERRKTGQKR
jgi:phosphoribosylformylglycinamidine synthase